MTEAVCHDMECEMRKRIIADPVPTDRPGEANWLDLNHLATVEVTSENPAHSVESALLPGDAGPGWRAAAPGAQALRLRFDMPTRVRRVRLVFREDVVGRTQEFVLSWSGSDEHSHREIVRQQYTFSPPGTAVEVEDYRVDLDGVIVLELRVIPDIGGGDAVASVERVQIAGG